MSSCKCKQKQECAIISVLALNIQTLISKCTFMHKLSGHLIPPVLFPFTIMGQQDNQHLDEDCSQMFLVLSMPISKAPLPLGKSGRVGRNSLYSWHLDKGLQRGPVLSLRCVMSHLALSVYVCLMGERATKFIFLKGNNIVCSELEQFIKYYMHYGLVFHLVI